MPDLDQIETTIHVGGEVAINTDSLPVGKSFYEDWEILGDKLKKCIYEMSDSKRNILICLIADPRREQHRRWIFLMDLTPAHISQPLLSLAWQRFSDTSYFLSFCLFRPLCPSASNQATQHSNNTMGLGERWTAALPMQKEMEIQWTPDVYHRYLRYEIRFQGI